MKICLISPSLKNGGLERVMSELATYFASKKEVQVYLILLIRCDKFYSVSEKVQIIEPDFNYKNYSRVFFTFKILIYLRRTVKKINPSVVLCFGERYNSFAILSLIGTNNSVFVSDRSSPCFRMNLFDRLLKKVLYKISAGIIAQTSLSKEIAKKEINHHNITVIPNPIKKFNHRISTIERENIILNIGRLVRGKNQDKLMNIFASIDDKKWKLIFIGEGQERGYYENYAKELGIEDQVFFVGSQRDFYDYLLKSKIFAFTSESEGFPNALGEAMFFPLASISYDCVAGPKDLIRDGENGFLVPLDDDAVYAEKLKMLMNCEVLRLKFENQAMMDKDLFSIETIGERYYETLRAKKRIDNEVDY